MWTTSASLLQRLRQPENLDAWPRFVQLYTPLIYHWARRAGLTDDDAADLVQDVLLTLVQKLPEFELDPTGSFRRWLKAVTLNKWRDLARRRRLPASVDHSINAVEIPVPDNVAELIDDDYRTQLVGRALALMQRDFQPATWKACWEVAALGRPPAEVAAELGLGVGAVYAAKFRVLARLRQELEGLLD